MTRTEHLAKSYTGTRVVTDTRAKTKAMNLCDFEGCVSGQRLQPAASFVANARPQREQRILEGQVRVNEFIFQTHKNSSEGMKGEKGLLLDLFRCDGEGED